MKVLIYDIETAPNLGFIWGKWEQNVIEYEREWYMLCFAYKWLGSSKTHVVSLPDFEHYEPGSPDDFDLVEKLHDLFDQADVVIAHNGDCVTVDTPVLKRDLTWVPAGELKAGDELIAFEEGREPETSPRDKDRNWVGIENSVRKMQFSTVESHRIDERECLEIEFSNGDKITTTKSHYWLGMAEKDNNQRWYRAEKLRVGQRVIKYFEPWETDNSYEAGWLSGFIAGEGTLKGDCTSIDYCQRPGKTMDQALEYSRKLGIDISEPKVKVGGLGRGDTEYIYTRGGKFKTLETIGKLQIKRLANNITEDKLGSLRGQNTDYQTIVAIREVGLKKVAIMETSSKTYFAGGYPMHNCFDQKKAHARFVYHNMTPPSPYKQIDTKKVAKRYFNFNSNKLDDLGEHFKLGRKVNTGGFELWKGCMAGDTAAWNKMKRYNKQDVDLLEKVYLRMRPWMVNHPSIAVTDEIFDGCPVCGGTDRQKRGYNYTKTGRKQRYQCLTCGSWHSDKHTETLKDIRYVN